MFSTFEKYQLILASAALVATILWRIIGKRVIVSTIFFLLALATIKPQLALPAAAWLLLWAASDWRRRGRFLWSFAGTTFVLVSAAEYILPGWAGRFRDAVSAYRQYTGGAGGQDRHPRHR